MTMLTPSAAVPVGPKTTSIAVAWDRRFVARCPACHRDCDWYASFIHGPLPDCGECDPAAA